MKQKLDNIYIGLIAGLIGPFFGFLIYKFIKFPHRDFEWYFNFFQRATVYQSDIVVLSLLFNLATFFGALYANMNKAPRGILMATFMYAPLIIYLRFFA